MSSKWSKEKEKLNKLINEENLSYTKIGKIYGCSGTNIKKVARKLNIKLPVRCKNNGRIPHNKNTAKKYFCLNCGIKLNTTNQHNRRHKFCSNKCQMEYNYKKWVENYHELNENQTNIATVGKIWKQMSAYLRRYIFEKFDNKCCICGWSEINPYTHTLPLEIDHIDGDATNNCESNLRLICPNCHSLTRNYRGANRGYGRNITWIPKIK